MVKTVIFLTMNMHSLMLKMLDIKVKTFEMRNVINSSETCKMRLCLMTYITQGTNTEHPPGKRCQRELDFVSINYRNKRHDFFVFYKRCQWIIQLAKPECKKYLSGQREILKKNGNYMIY